MGFDTDDTLLNVYLQRVGGQEMSRDLERWLKSRMVEIDRRLSELRSRLTVREARNSAR